MDTNKTAIIPEVLEVKAPVLHTPIQAATALGKAPQYLYQLIRSDKIPAEHTAQFDKGDGTFRILLRDSFFTWYASRAANRVATSTGSTRNTASAVVTRQATLEELMDAMAVKLEATGNKKFAGLADALKSIVTPAASPVENLGETVPTNG